MKNNQAKAFTLIEAIVALAIVAIALVALLRLHLISIQLHDKTQKTQRATFLATEKLEETLATGYPKLGTRSGTEEELHWQVKVSKATLPNSQLTQLKNLRQIEVTTHWNDTSGIQLTTLITPRSAQ